MNETTAATRKGAHESGDKERDLLLVFNIFLDAGRPIGASEVCEIAHRPLTSLRPRVSELLKLGKIQAVKGIRHLMPNGSTESVYTAIKFDGNQALIPGVA